TNELLELESICKFLKPFEIATTILSKDLSNSISEALTIILEIEQHINNIKHNSNAYTCSISSNSEKKTEDHTTYDVFFSKRRIAKKRRINTLEYELDLYEREPLENFENENNDIKTNMARDFLSMQPSSVASERAFSHAGFTVTNDRANLNENT
ncbi:6364_t:CDS:2, partial [Gigaspora rosea]